MPLAKKLSLQIETAATIRCLRVVILFQSLTLLRDILFRFCGTHILCGRTVAFFTHNILYGYSSFHINMVFRCQFQSVTGQPTSSQPISGRMWFKQKAVLRFWSIGHAMIFLPILAGIPSTIGI